MLTLAPHAPGSTGMAFRREVLPFGSRIYNFCIFSPF